jgi:hypothetical protein
MKTIKLTRNQETFVSEEDYEYLVSLGSWCAELKRDKDFHAIRRGNIRMHNVIAERKFGKVPDGLVVDHIDHNPLNNVRENIRLATKSQNMWNSVKRCEGSSKLKGVSWNKNAKKFTAKICVNYKQIHLGYFASEQEASEAYNKASAIYHGKFGSTESLVNG